MTGEPDLKGKVSLCLGEKKERESIAAEDGVRAREAKSLLQGLSGVPSEEETHP